MVAAAAGAAIRRRLRGLLADRALLSGRSCTQSFGREPLGGQPLLVLLSLLFAVLALEPGLEGIFSPSFFGASS